MSRFRLVLGLMVLLSALSAFPCGAQSKAVKNQQNKKAKLEKEIQILDRQLKENASKSSSATTTLNLTRKKISARKELLAQCDAQIEELGSDIKAATTQIEYLEHHLDTLRTNYEKLVLVAYKMRDSRQWYMMLLASENLAQGYRRYSYMKNISHELNAQGVQMHRLIDSLEVKKDELELLKQQAQQTRDEREREMKTLRKEESDVSRQITALQKDKAKYEKELAVKRKQVESLKKEIEKLIAESLNTGSSKSSSKGKSGSSSKPKAPIDAKLDAEFASNKGRLPWPADGPVVDRYGRQYHPAFKSVEMPFNDGISIAVDPGTDACCVFDGIVRKIIVMPGYNQCVLVQHGSYFTFYCKLGLVYVKAGDKVKTGQKLGSVDTMGGETLLHFEVWEGSKTQDPANWLR